MLFEVIQQASPFIVVGKVQLWGRVIEGDRGYRAELAYPGALAFIGKSWLSERSERAIEESLDAYGAPWDVTTWGAFRDITFLCD